MEEIWLAILQMTWNWWYVDNKEDSHQYCFAVKLNRTMTCRIYTVTCCILGGKGCNRTCYCHYHCIHYYCMNTVYSLSFMWIKNFIPPWCIWQQTNLNLSTVLTGHHFQIKYPFSKIKDSWLKPVPLKSERSHINKTCNITLAICFLNNPATPNC